MKILMEKLIGLLNQIENPGTFSVNGQLSSVSPGLKVKGLGTVSLPVMPAQAQKLIELSDQAPYGRGEDTVLDTQVRKVWQISAKNFEISNQEWLYLLERSVEKIGIQLGLSDCKINFEPYKLLVYEEGSFFISHRDTEKIPNMFATLVINLPSEHRGGELIVGHGGKSNSYFFENNDGLHPDFVSFYADCYHEVKPVTQGYRICLIYNLAIANRKNQPNLAEQINLGEQVAQILQEWKQDARAEPMLTYLLEHSYSEENMRLDNLKNGDFSKASVLLNAAENNGCQAYLCLVTYYRSSCGSMSYQSRDYYREDEDEDDDFGEDEDDDDFDEYDVVDESVYAHSFTTRTGEKIAIEQITIEEQDILASIPLIDGEGRESSISEATGNEGATKELWYHRGAVIIWSPEHIFEVLEKTDKDYQFNFFKDLIANNKITQVNRGKVLKLAEKIINDMPFKDVSQELMTLGDTGLLKKFIHRQMTSRSAKNANDTFLKIMDFCGWEALESEIQSYLTPRHHAVIWLHSLLLMKQLSDEGRTMIKKWLQPLLESDLESCFLPTHIAIGIEIMALLDLDAKADELLALLSRQQQIFFSLTNYGPALLKAFNSLQGYAYHAAIMKKFVDHACQWLKNDFPQAPIPPQNQFREGQLRCHCSFCTPVNQLLPDTEKMVVMFSKTLKRNLLHVETEINASGVDVSLSISKVSNGFEGICRKNRKSYEQKLQLYDAAQSMLHDLQLR